MVFKIGGQALSLLINSTPLGPRTVDPQAPAPSSPPALCCAPRRPIAARPFRWCAPVQERHCIPTQVRDELFERSVASSDEARKLSDGIETGDSSLICQIRDPGHD